MLDSLAARCRTLAAAALAVAPLLAGSASASTLVGVSISSELWDVDPLTGALSNLRTTPVNGFGGLTFLDTGQLVATRHYISDYGLYDIDVATGAASEIVSFGFDVIEGGVAQDPTTGVVYAVNGVPSGGGTAGLFSIDIGAGTTSFIGSLLGTGGLGYDASGLVFLPDGSLYILGGGSAAALYQVDPTTATLIDEIPLVGISFGTATAGLTYDAANDRVLMGFDYELFELDVGTGVATSIGPTDYVELSGLAWSPRSLPSVPEPGAAWLVLSGAVALWRCAVSDADV